MASTFIDGDLYATDGGSVSRFVLGKNEGWTAKPPKDTLLRPAPSYSLIAAGGERRAGNIYALDRANARIVALAKVDGKYVAQYRVAGGLAQWSDLRGMYVIAGVDPAPSTLVWISRDGVHQAILVAVADASPAGSAAPSSSASPPGGSSTPSKTP
jgi:hypothetical protein